MPIAICNIKCTGEEDQLADCALQPSCTQANGYSSCSHNDDVGVTCSEYSITIDILTGISYGAESLANHLKSKNFSSVHEQ